MLNPKYYKDLFKKYAEIYPKNKFPFLVSSMILHNYRQQNVYFNIPNREEAFAEIISRVYIELAFFAFVEFADFPSLNIGDKVKKKEGSKKDIYKISKVCDNYYTLTNEKDASLVVSGIKYDTLLTSAISC